ncbi:MAG: AbrB/MazE/SpoVT family DNA-binding domain-containing protein [Steroidobacteraceae bacterium]
MTTTRLSSKGQVVLPKAVREACGWRAGVELTVDLTPAGVTLRARKPFAPSRPEQVFGRLRHAGAALTLEEMHSAVARRFGPRRTGR